MGVQYCNGAQQPTTGLTCFINEHAYSQQPPVPMVFVDSSNQSASDTIDLTDQTTNDCIDRINQIATDYDSLSQSESNSNTSSFVDEVINLDGDEDEDDQDEDDGDDSITRVVVSPNTLNMLAKEFGGDAGTLEFTSPPVSAASQKITRAPVVRSRDGQTGMGHLGQNGSTKTANITPIYIAPKPATLPTVQHTVQRTVQPPVHPTVQPTVQRILQPTVTVQRTVHPTVLNGRGM